MRQRGICQENFLIVGFMASARTLAVESRVLVEMELGDIAAAMIFGEGTYTLIYCSNYRIVPIHKHIRDN